MAFAVAPLPPRTEASAGLFQPATADSFELLLEGIYEPVVRGPNLGLTQVNLDDGTYARTKIFRFAKLPGTTNQPVGNFYVNADITLCAYQLPGGTFAARFTDFTYENVEIGGQLYQVGTAELVILEGNGIYRSFVNGSIHMEFSTQVIDDVTFDEHCICFVHR